MTVGELIDNGEATLQTGPFGTQLKASEYVPVGVPIINVKNLGYGDVRVEALDYVNDKTAHRLRVHSLKTDDIVFGRKGSADRHALIRRGQDGWLQGSDCMRLRLKSDRVTSHFLSYYFCTSGHKYWMEAVCAFGATMSTLNHGIVRRISFHAPSIRAQKKITGILSSCDELIDNNRRRIDLLERLGSEIYREWFVRMRPSGGLKVTFKGRIPVGWTFDRGSRFFDIVKGRSYAGHEISEDPLHMPFISLKSFNRGGGYREDGLKYFSGRFKDSQVVRQGNVVMAVTDMTQDRAVVGRVARMPYLGDRGAVISLDAVKLVPKDINNTFLYGYLRYSGFSDFIKEFANGANVLHLNPDLITKQRIAIPPRSLQNEFELRVSPLYAQIDTLSEINRQMFQMRNRLLPRLISGQLSVDFLDLRSIAQNGANTEL